MKPKKIIGIIMMLPLAFFIGSMLIISVYLLFAALVSWDDLIPGLIALGILISAIIGFLLFDEENYNVIKTNKN